MLSERLTLPLVVESRLRGIVSEILLYEEEEVNAGTQAVTIIDDRSYILKTSLSDRDAPDIRKLGASAVTGITPEGESHKGRIRQISLEPDYSTGLFTLTMEFPRSDELFLGMILFVDLQASEPSGIMVESSALLSVEGKKFLWIVNEDNQILRRFVDAGKIVDEKVTINGGLAAGERYVREPDGNEVEGMGLRELIMKNMEGSSVSGGQ